MHHYPSPFAAEDRENRNGRLWRRRQGRWSPAGYRTMTRRCLRWTPLRIYLCCVMVGIRFLVTKAASASTDLGGKVRVI